MWGLHAERSANDPALAAVVEAIDKGRAWQTHEGKAASHSGRVLESVRKGSRV